MNDRMSELRNEQLQEYGVTQEQAQAVKKLLEENDYRVDMDYFWNISSNKNQFPNQEYASLTFHNGLFVMTNSSSHFKFEEVQVYKTQVDKVLELLNKIHTIAPNVVDATFRDKRIEEARQEAKRAIITKIAYWNALPPQESILTLSNGDELVLKRSKTEYHQGYSTHYWLGYELGGATFYPASYITSSGAVQKKKFKERYDSLSEQDLATLLEQLPALLKRQNEAERGSF